MVHVLNVAIYYFGLLHVEIQTDIPHYAPVMVVQCGSLTSNRTDDVVVAQELDLMRSERDVRRIIISSGGKE